MNPTQCVGGLAARHLLSSVCVCVCVSERECLAEGDLKPGKRKTFIYVRGPAVDNRIEGGKVNGTVQQVEGSGLLHPHILSHNLLLCLLHTITATLTIRIYS